MKYTVTKHCVFFPSDPVPPKHVTTDIHDRNVKVSWSEPARTFFQTEGFIIQYTTDNWEKFIEKTVPEDEHELSIHIEPPSTILQVKIYTYIKSSIRSLPSNEVKVDLRGKLFISYLFCRCSFVPPYREYIMDI